MIMKNQYVKPEMHEEEFIANIYVAACGDSGKTFNFECNAPVKGNHWSYTGRYDKVYYWSNSKFNPTSGNIPSFGTYSGTKASSLGGYHPCTEKHPAGASTNFYLGYVDRDDDGKYDEGEGVIIWRGNKNDNVHCTKELDVDSWEVLKS